MNHLPGKSQESVPDLDEAANKCNDDAVFILSCRPCDETSRKATRLLPSHRNAWFEKESDGALDRSPVQPVRSDFCEGIHFIIELPKPSLPPKCPRRSWLGSDSQPKPVAELSMLDSPPETPTRSWMRSAVTALTPTTVAMTPCSVQKTLAQVDHVRETSKLDLPPRMPSKHGQFCWGVRNVPSSRASRLGRNQGSGHPDQNSLEVTTRVPYSSDTASTGNTGRSRTFNKGPRVTRQALSGIQAMGSRELSPAPLRILGSRSVSENCFYPGSYQSTTAIGESGLYRIPPRRPSMFCKSEKGCQPLPPKPHFPTVNTFERSESGVGKVSEECVHEINGHENYRDTGGTANHRSRYRIPWIETP